MVLDMPGATGCSSTEAQLQVTTDARPTASGVSWRTLHPNSSSSAAVRRQTSDLIRVQMLLSTIPSRERWETTGGFAGQGIASPP